MHHPCHLRRKTKRVIWIPTLCVMMIVIVKDDGPWKVIWHVPTHQLGQTPQLCQSSRRKHRRCCCPSPHKAGALFLWWPSSLHSSKAYILHSLWRKRGEITVVRDLTWLQRRQRVNGAWRQRGLECSRRSLEPHIVVSQGLELGSHQMICKGSPRRISFTQACGYN